MRALFLSLFLLAACDDEPPGFGVPLPPPGPVTVTPDKLSTDLVLLRKSIQEYKAAHGDANPPDLKALAVDEKLTYPTTLPIYEYDAATGKVRAPDYPGL